jgi:hypothetical protein
VEKGDVTPALKWEKKEDEEQVKAAFKKVAEASGSFLGLTNPLSEAEFRMIEPISAFFGKSAFCN